MVIRSSNQVCWWTPLVAVQLHLWIEFTDIVVTNNQLIYNTLVLQRNLSDCMNFPSLSFIDFVCIENYFLEMPKP